MKLLVFADLHFMDYARWKEFLKIDHALYDAVCLLGDIDILLLKSIKANFSDKPIFGILGNHDYLGDLEYYEIFNIHGKIVEKDNVRFLGIEGCVRYKKGQNIPLHEQKEITNMLRVLSYSDVVVSHNSPKGIHDKEDKAHEGYEGLIEYIHKKQPRYVLHGHQHENIRTLVNKTEVIGIYGGVIFDTNSGHVENVLKLGEM